MQSAAIVYGLILSVVLAIVLGLILSLPLMWLWNMCLVGAVSGVNEIGWLQAWGLMILCGLLFKNVSVSTESK